MVRTLGILGILASFAVIGADNPPSSSLFTSAAQAPEGAVIGTFELRPSYRSQIGEFHAENSAFLGYKFATGQSIYYKQEFNTNIYNPTAKAGEGGLSPYAYDGSLRWKLGSIWEAPSAGLALSYEGRWYV